MPSALTISHLKKTYGTTDVVDDLSLTIEEGEIFGLLGPNGAGKSTTINLVTGVCKMQSGTVNVFGFDNQAQYQATRRLIGVMHQEIVVDTFFTIDKALEIHAGYYGVKDDPQWRNELVERLALGPHLKKSMNRLSGGMKRRFMVAKALIHKPRLLILDEPTAGVDVELRQNLWDFVKEMNQKRNTTVLLTTHYLEEAEKMCQRVAIMNFGKILALDHTSKILDRLDERRLIVHVNQKMDAIPKALNSFACELFGDGMSMSLKVGQGTDMNRVLRAIHDSNLQIREFETKAPSLQEAFLKITGAHANMGNVAGKN